MVEFEDILMMNINMGCKIWKKKEENGAFRKKLENERVRSLILLTKDKGQKKKDKRFSPFALQ